MATRYDKVRQRIKGIITDNIKALDKEIEEFEQKLEDTQSFYGYDGGAYYRQEQALGRRLRDKEALEDLLNDSNRITVKTTELRLNYFTCRNCGSIVFTTATVPRGYHECPVCGHQVYSDSSYKASLEVAETAKSFLQNVKEKLLEEAEEKLK